jgi:hypothetical protein
MRTTCYCIFCPKHPYFNKQKELMELGRISGWHSNQSMPLGFSSKAGAEVDCLYPKSDAFHELDIEPEDVHWETTAYGDGCAETGYQGCGYEINAYCGNEEYKELK